MPQKSPHFKFEYFKRGSSYSGGSDQRRFITLDYNMESYVGIIGVGVIKGWTIEHVDGLDIKILPGTGIIDGFYSESDYIFKQRSGIVSGEIEVEVVNTDAIPEPNLTVSQKNAYVAIRQEYEPSYNPSGNVENSYVKVVVPYTVTLSDNADTYIYAKRKYPEGTSPAFDGYEEIPLDKPFARQYSLYSEYKEALDEYNALLSTNKAYSWRSIDTNHFTAVDFQTSAVNLRNTNQILIGKVVTRSGIVTKIDTKGVESLENMASAASTRAKPYITGHHHGGNQAFDPTKIKLETDIRKTSVNLFSRKGLELLILENTETSVSVGHKHLYWIDNDGNGFTTSINGSDFSHFHKIKAYTVGIQEYSASGINNHIHTITNPKEIVDPNSAYIVYVNGAPSTDGVEVDLVKGLIILRNVVGEVYQTYSSGFKVTLSDGSQEDYYYKHSSPSVFAFMLKMEADFFTRYPFGKIIMVDEEGNEDYSNHPFLFVEGASNADEAPITGHHPQIAALIRKSKGPSQESSGTIVGIEELKSQSSIAQTLLRKTGDTFTFTPNAAKNITITREENYSTSKLIADYDVRIEIVGNTEVTGILRNENIAFIDATKFKLGKFELAKIPVINHLGRMGEEFVPFQYPLSGSNGYQYSVVPSITTVDQGHYHKMSLDQYNNGKTANTYISETPVYYVYSNGASYLIAHTHAVDKGDVVDVTSNAVASWYTSVYGSSNATATHTHSVIYPMKSDPKTVYSVSETADGSILMGTSSGLYISANSSSYLFVVNEIQVYGIGNDLWELLLDTKTNYEVMSNRTLEVTEDIYYSQIQQASNVLVNDGDSVVLLGAFDPVYGQDTILLQKVDSFKLPHFKYSQVKLLNEVEDDETVIALNIVNALGAGVSYDSKGGIIDSQVYVMAKSEKDLQDVPIWSMATTSEGEVFTCGATVYSKNINIERNLYADWSRPIKPNFVGSLNNLYMDSQKNIWMVSENGPLIARSYQNGEVIEAANPPYFRTKTMGVTEGGIGKIYIATEYGIGLTTDYGKTWTEVLSVADGCRNVTKDNNQSILYAVANNSQVFKSVNGTNWELIGSIPTEEVGEIIAFNGYIYIGLNDGLYRSLATAELSWIKVLDVRPYSLSFSQGNESIFVGCDNVVYETMDGVVFAEIVNLDGANSPSIYYNESKRNFGYAYSTISQKFFFKNFTYSNDPISALVDFNLWIASHGSWTDDSDFDIYVDKKLIYSTKKNIDNRDASGYNFSTSPSQGTLDFGIKTSLKDAANVNSEFLSVVSNSGFEIGDSIYVFNVTPDPEKLNLTESISVRKKDDVEKLEDKINTYYNAVNKKKSMFFYATISNVTDGKLFLDKNTSVKIDLPASVYKVPSTNGESSIFSNIYDSMLSNIGRNTHEELEDKVSYASDNRPYQLNNAYLSNLLQLTQAVKYAYPDIDSNMLNTKFFDFRYSPLENDSLPYVGDVIDLQFSEIYNEGIFDSRFLPVKSKSVNRILVGHGTFDGLIIIATEIGVFYSKYDTDSMEYNWFFSNGFQIRVNDIIIVDGKKLLAATDEGIYETEDLTNWKFISQASVDLPMYTFSYRWIGRETVKVPPSGTASATFSVNFNGSGLITNGSGLYGGIKPGRIITISGAEDKDGNYSVSFANQDQIFINGVFPGVDATHNNVVINMGGWWEYLSGDTSTRNNLIKNTIMAGGRSMISYSDNIVEDKPVWRQSEFPDGISQFFTSDIYPLSIGIVLASINGTDTLSIENNIIKSTGDGSIWERFLDITKVAGKILEIRPTPFGHSMAKIEYQFPENFNCEDNSLKSRDITLFVGSKKISSSVCSNEKRNNEDYIAIYGQEAFSLFEENPDITFFISPPTINKIIESSENHLFYGTDIGLYTDKGSTIVFPDIYGDVVSAGNSGTVTKIDIEGTVQTITSNSEHVVVNVTTNDIITNNQLVGQRLHIVESSSPIFYVILSNKSSGPNGGVSIEVDSDFTKVPNSIWNGYINKKVVVAKDNESRIYAQFDFPISLNQFSGGKIYISSKDKNNFGDEYVVTENTKQYITVTPSIVPYTELQSGNNSICIGQQFKMVESDNRVRLFVLFDKSDVALNQMAGLKLKLIPESTIVELSVPLKINSNTPYEIILEPIQVAKTTDTSTSDAQEKTYHPVLNLDKLSRFKIIGSIFRPANEFNDRRLSITDGHYHDTSLIGIPLEATISSLSFSGTSYVDLTVENINGFDNAVLLIDGTIINGCKVYLRNPNNTQYVYETTAVSYSGGTLRLNAPDHSIWDITSYSYTKISPSWRVLVEAKYCGFSISTLYSDFNAASVLLTEDIIDQSNLIKVVSTAGIFAGDKIELVDALHKSFVTTVSNVVDSVTLETEDFVENTFLVLDGSFIKVLRDSFSNTHTHKISNSQVETIIVEDYNNRGYPSYHSHQLCPYIKDISDMALSDKSVLIVGSDREIYSRNSDGHCEALIDLNRSLEWGEEIISVTNINVSGNRIIAGTSNGQIFSNTFKNQNNIPIENPI